MGVFRHGRKKKWKKMEKNLDLHGEKENDAMGN